MNVSGTLISGSAYIKNIFIYFYFFLFLSNNKQNFSCKKNVLNAILKISHKNVSTKYEFIIKIKIK